MWDSWPIDDHLGNHHLFYLKAPRSLKDPELRHFSPRVGHAVSHDYRRWLELPDALAPNTAPAWDDAATWTGSIIAVPDGGYRMFYTGASASEDGLVQRIGCADSDDLITWTRSGTEALLEADPQWYEKFDGRSWGDEAWRDPWVFADPGGVGWHMLITARAAEGELNGRGVIGHAWSADLDCWEARPPLSEPSGFGQLEVIQPFEFEGTGYLLFSCETSEMDPLQHPPGERGGTWILENVDPLGPFDLDRARRVGPDELYAARAVIHQGRPHLCGFANLVDGEFVGEIMDPVPLFQPSEGPANGY